MHLTTLEITPEQAAEALTHYEAALRVERNAEDEAIAAGYRAAARGLPILRLTSAFNAAGRFDDGLPRLAICRADATECWVRRAGETHWVFSDQRFLDNRGALVGTHTVRVGVDEAIPWSVRNAKTIVPLIPPQHRPKRGRLRGYHVLWEVESWTPEPPRDPALLRHIRGDLWAVLAVWDLTDLERYVITGRAS